MRKKIYLCTLLLFSVSMMAQVNGDYSWESLPYFFEDFTGNGRGWGRDFIEFQQGNNNFNPHWRCYYDEWDSGVTLDYNQHHIFQRGQCRFNPSNGTMLIVTDFINNTPILCGNYELPYPSWHYNHCDYTHHWLYYYSGCIETIESFRYGYFEIRCKLPVHQGAFPAFWLWGRENNRYEEIDILEYMWNITYPSYNNQSPYSGYPYIYDSGIWYRGQNEVNRKHYASQQVYLPTDNQDLTGWHTYGCEWSPGLVIWYCDGKIVNDFHDEEHVPQGHLNLKANYSIDNWALENHDLYDSQPFWQESDSLVIDYIKIVKLKSADCDTDLHITTLTQWLNYDYHQKKSITIGDGTQSLIAPTNSKTVLRASDYIVINGVFEAPVGVEIILLAHGCPEEE